MKTKIALGLFAIIVSGASAFGQCKGWTWPDSLAEREQAEEKNVLYNDLLKQDNFNEAVPPLQWLLANTPKLNTSIYINGAKIYQKLADAEQDPVQKYVYVDSALWMYDMRIEMCGDEVNVLNRKIIQAYKYFGRDKEKWEYLLEIYDDAFQKAGDKFSENNLIPYMTIIRLNKVGLKSLTDDQVFDKFDAIKVNADNKLMVIQAAGKDAGKIKTKIDRIDGMLPDIVKMDCDNVREKLGPRLEANPHDLKLAKIIFSFMLNGKCTDDPLWVKSAQLIQKEEPTSGLAKILGSKCFATKDYECADQYYDEAITLTEDGTEQAEIHMLKGKMKASQGIRAGARADYRNVLAADPSMKEAYVAIGDLYMNSFETCKKEESIVQDRAVFIAAYNMYSRGGDATKMANAKSQFPSIEDIFNATRKKGDQITVSCWINETVTLDTRD